MKFVFYNKKKNGKTQTIKAETADELRQIATIAKCELTKASILKDLDFDNSKLICKIKDKELNMKELWKFISKKLDEKSSSKEDKKKSTKKKSKKISKESSKKKGDKKKKKKDKSSKKKKKSDHVIATKTCNVNKSTQNSNGLVHITRKR